MQDNDKLIKKCFDGFLFSSVFATLGGNISIMIDNAITGQFLGDGALAAMSLVTPVFFFFTALGTLICAGAAAVASTYIGKNEYHKSNQFFTLATFLVLSVGILVSFVGSFFINEIALLLTKDKDLIPLVVGYLKALIPGGIAIMLVYLPLNFFRIEGRTQIALLMFIVMAISDIVLDIVFVVVIPMGMFGAALATVLSSILGVLVVVPFFFSKINTLRIVSIKSDENLFLKILTYGSPLALNNVYSIIRITVLNGVILGVGGSIGVASFAFANSINVLAQAFISGIAGSVSPLVGIFKGERDFKSIKTVIKLATKKGVTYMLIFTGLCILFASPVTSFFGIVGADNKKIAISALIITSISLSLALINTIFIYYYNVTSKILLSNIITICRGLIFIILPAFFLSKVFGMTGIWLSFILCEILTFVTFMLITQFYIKKNPKLSPVLLLDEHKDEKNNYFGFSVSANIESVVESSVKITDFCEEIGLTSKQTMLISLSIEEILIIIVNHGLGDKASEPANSFIDVRIVQFEDMIIMRFRSGGKRFNPIEFYENALEQNLPEVDDCLGIKMLMGLVENIDYSANLGLNNIIICI